MTTVSAAHPVSARSLRWPRLVEIIARLSTCVGSLRIAGYRECIVDESSVVLGV